ncbi:MAG: Gfo/Idh/MocA family oxidoreductase [Bryobacteraceae bacterium]
MSDTTTAIGRRGFLASVGTGALLSGRVLGANDRVNVGVIGIGRQGTSDLRAFLKQPDVAIASLCDVYQPNLDAAGQLVTTAKRVGDFREILDDKDIDAVLVATPDHWHALLTIMACRAGKDVYVEKPASVTIAEGRTMVEAARKYKRVVQVNTQQHSGAHFHKAVDIIHSGALGKISLVRAWHYANEFPDGIGNPPDGAPPSGLNWDLWLGPAPAVPYNANRFGVAPGRWSTFRYFWDYAGGQMTDLGVHAFDIIHWAMRADAPVSVSASGGKFSLKDNRDTPDLLQVTFEYPEFVCVYESRVANGIPLNARTAGIAFHGINGTLTVNPAGFEVVTEDRRQLPGTGAEKVSGDQLASHVRNFLDCVKSRGFPVADIEVGHRSTSACHLGNIAYRSGHKIRWDAKKEKLVDDKRASRYLARPYRKPWKLEV